MSTWGLVLLWIIAGIQPVILALILLLAPAIRDHHQHWNKGTDHV